MTARPEQLLQLAVVEFLEATLLPAAAWTTFPAGGGGALRGAILAGLGLRAGWPDIQLLAHGGRYHGLELKSPRGRRSPEQVSRHAEIERAGGRVATVHSLDQVISTLQAWDMPMRGFK